MYYYYYFFFFSINVSLDQWFFFCFFFNFSSQKGFKDTLLRKWSFFFSLQRHNLFMVFILKAFRLTVKLTNDSKATVVSHRAVLMTRWLKAVLVHHTSYLASVSASAFASHLTGLPTPVLLAEKAVQKHVETWFKARQECHGFHRFRILWASHHIFLIFSSLKVITIRQCFSLV